jgi:PAS domain S-box-containing protein
MSGLNVESRTAAVEPTAFGDMITSSDQVLFLVATDMSSIFYVSPAYERMTGYSCQSAYENSRAWLDSVYEEDRPHVHERVSKRLSGELRGRSEIEYRIRTAAGEIIWLRTIMKPVCDETGQVRRLVGFSEEITERKQSELALKDAQAALARKVEARTEELSQTVSRLQQEIEHRKQIETELRRSEAQSRQLFEANIIGVLFSDIYGNIFDANEAFLKMTGYSRSDLPLRWDKMTPPEWSHMSDLAVQQVVREGSIMPFEKEYFRKDGTRVPVLVGATLLDRETWQCVSFIHDLSSRKNAEEQVREVSLQLQHASQVSVMGAIVADMAHEIHQPLGVIANYANGSLRRMESGQLTANALKEKLREIAAESTRVSEILRRLREFVRRREPERKPVNLNEIVTESLQFTRLERREHRVAVIFRPDRNLPAIQADRVQITQVLVNLVVNAIHAASTPDREYPKILISTYLNDEGYAEISVADNGPGIAIADLPHIFDRFFTTKSGGLGLGLPISRSIIEAHGGKLWCDSTPGESAVFRLTLPTHKTQDAPVA